MTHNRTSKILFACIVAVTLYFALLPIIGVILYGIFPFESWALLMESAKRSFPYLGNSLFIATLVTVISVVIGSISSFALWRLNIVKAGLLRKLMLLPMINPPFVGSIAFIMLFGRRGLITHELLGLSISPFGWQGIVIMQSLSLSALAYLLISSSIQKTNVTLEKAALTLGAHPVYILRTITLPVMLPEISTAAVLVFLASMADFGTPLIIGGAFQTLASDLYIQITGLYDMRSAAVSGILLIIPCIIFFLIQRRQVATRQYYTRMTEQSDLTFLHFPGKLKGGFIIVTVFYVFAVLMKYTFIVIGAFTHQWGYDYTPTLRHVKKVLSKDLSPFLNSIQLAFWVALFASLLGVLLSYLIKRKNFRASRFIDFIGTLPAAIPGILMGIGYLVVFKYPLLGAGRFYLENFKGITLLGTPYIVYLICIFRYMNVGLRSGYALIEHLNPDLEDAARILGASEFRLSREIVLPLMTPAFSSAFFKNYSTTMTTLGAIIFLLLPSNKVAVQQIFQIITSSENGVAAAMAILLSTITALMLLIFRVLYNRIIRSRI